MDDRQSPPVVELKNVETRFGRQEVHRGISFSLKAATVVALIGGSGCGKTVLLKEIIGLLKPTAGTISLFGLDVLKANEWELSRVRNRIGVLFQNGALFSNLTVAQNVAVPLKEETRFSAALIQELVALRLALSGLAAESGAKMPSELSGGMRKRAALARALALEPELLLLDEPTSGLDPINARAFDKLVRTLCDSLKLTVLMVTHDLDTLASIVDRVIVLGEGLVIADGPVSEVACSRDPWIREYFSSRAG